MSDKPSPEDLEKWKKALEEKAKLAREKKALEDQLNILTDDEDKE